MTTRRLHQGMAWLLAALWVPAGCCYSRRPKAAEPLQLPQEMIQPCLAPQEVPEAHTIRRDYRLRPGDHIEIIYHVRHQRTESYRIKIEDVIQLRFPFARHLDQVQRVESDGALHLDLIGPVFVFDRTIDEVQAELIERYSKYLVDPKLTLSFKESNVKIRELKEAIKTAPRGMSRLVPVSPDGTVSLPFVVDIRAAGLTIGELHHKVNEAYRELGLPELEVTVNLQSIAPMRVYVLGEVRIPGALLDKTGALAVANELTLLQALAHAGSYIPGRAELSRVLLIRRGNLPRPQCAIINVYHLLENRKSDGDKATVADTRKNRYDVWLQDGDIVYVPTTDIAKRADYIEYVWTRGIRAVGGFSSSATYNINDSVDWLEPNP